MKLSNLKNVAAATVLGLALVGGNTQARAAIGDYEFKLVNSEIRKGETVIAVRLMNKATGKPVPDAVIFATRLDMAPDNMQKMTTKVTPVPGSEPGVYRFKADLGMAGGWQLSLGAKIPGETGSVANKLVIKVVP